MKVFSCLYFCLLVAAGFAPGAGAVEAGKPAAAATQRFLTSTLTKSAPSIDGALNDEVWQKAAESSGFFRNTQGNPAAKSWLSHQIFHSATLLVTLLLTLKVVLGLVHAFQGGEGLGHFVSSEGLAIVGLLVALGGLFYFAQPRGEVHFNESNAIDVESMGLYWHFVDIVWIVIFTAVYLLEYI